MTQTVMQPSYDAENLSWQSVEARLAAEHGLAVVVVRAKDSTEISKSGNNSICEHLYSSEEFAPRCAEYCGRAFQIAAENGKPTHVKCHADLNFFTVPVRLDEHRHAVAIAGRTFIKSEDYRKATTRASEGDWRQFPADEFFSNVLISGSLGEAEKLARRVENLDDEERRLLAKFIDERAAKSNPEIKKSPENAGAPKVPVIAPQAVPPSANLSTETNNPPADSARSAASNTEEMEKISAWRSFFGNILNLDYKTACQSFLEFLDERHDVSEAAWLSANGGRLEMAAARGDLQKREIEIALDDEAGFLEAARRESALEFRARGDSESSDSPTIRVFPVAVGGEIRAALAIGGDLPDAGQRRRLAGYARRVAPQFEILRLRAELERRRLLAEATRRFNESLKNTDDDNFWSSATETAAALVRAERSSLLIYDAETGAFSVKAASGRRADAIRSETETLGAKVAGTVLESGRSLVVEDVEKSAIPPAPPEWGYRTKSFISFPIKIDGRKIGVFNATDKAGGGAYDAADAELLQSFAPQLAMALDRTSLKKKAGEFEQLSITDALTGLRNRRYLEERLAEEISRSRRHGYPLSFAMIDVDEFKSYNDQFTHPEGDKALQIVGHCLKATLRGADVAARYGGEEFSILLPQTNLGEAQAIAERIRRLVETTRFPNRKVTISVGVATCTPRLCAPQLLVSAADRALYRAKKAGRNNVQLATETEGN